jgi:hypothetical protein
MQGVAQGIASSASTLVAGFAVTLLFFDSRERREGPALAAALANLDGAGEEGDPVSDRGGIEAE